MEESSTTLLKGVLKKYFNRKDAFLLPNILCYIRVLLMVLFTISYILSPTIGDNRFAYVYLSCGIMALAEYTDFLDGFIARRFNMTSYLGKALDPICDKLSLLCIGIALVAKFYHFVLVIILVSLYVAKELWMTISALILATKGKTYKQSRWYGKMTTFICYFTLGLMLIAGPFIIDLYSSNGEYLAPAYWFINVLSGVSIFFLTFTLIAYSINFRNILVKEEVEVSLD